MVQLNRDMLVDDPIENTSTSMNVDTVDVGKEWDLMVMMYE